MMAGKMYDYLPTKTAEYTTALTLTPQNVLEEEGGRHVQFNESDSGVMEAVLLAGQTTFTVTLEWENMSAAESDTVMDYYLDPAKGAFGARTFLWQHPIDGASHLYVVRFLGKLKRSIRSTNWRDIKSVQLLVEGKA